MGGTIRNEREKLDGHLTWLERWIVFAGFAVAIGVAIEIGSKVIKHEIDNEVIGGAIVILGVAIEVILTFVAAQKTSRVQELANFDVAQANERAAHALERAATLQAEFAWRELSDPDRLLIRENLTQFKEQPFDFVSVFSDPESMNFCADIKGALESAGWIGRSGGGIIAGPTFPGVRIVVHRDDLELPAFLALLNTFGRIGVRGIATSEPANVSIMPNAVLPGRISIHVGRKPRKEDTWPVTPPQA